MPVILLLALLILTQMMVILLLELCTHRRPMVKTEWKDVQECPKEYLFEDSNARLDAVPTTLTEPACRVCLSLSLTLNFH